MRISAPVLVVFLSVAGLSATADARRYAIAVAENEGAHDQVTLRYAQADARRFLDVMIQLGGLRAEDSVTLTELNAARLREGLEAAQARFAKAGWGPQDQLFVYVSSHAAEGALQLRGTSYPIAELRAFVERVPVGVAVLILDACQAAWLSRTKGLDPLTTRSVTVERSTVRGRVMVLSSGPTEASHESDAVGSSYFTHHLVAGLRGPADTSKDGRVTLHEAFAYAHDRTVEATLSALGGRQTPRYDLRLAGDGELVLTEPAQGRGILEIAVARAGEWIVAESGGAGDLTRFTKGPGTVLFSVTPGTYRVRTSDGATDLEGTVVVGDGRRAIVRDADLAGWSRPRSRSKGRSLGWSVALDGTAGTSAVRDAAWAFGGVVLAAGLTAPHALLGDRTWYELSAGLRVGETASTTRQYEVDLGVALGPMWALSALDLRAGLQAGGVLVQQELVSGGDRTGFQPRLGAIIGLQWPLVWRLHLDVRLSGGVQWTTLETEDRVAGYGLAAVGLGVW